MHADDIREDLLGWSLLVHGKGNRMRLCATHPRGSRSICERSERGVRVPWRD